MADICTQIIKKKDEDIYQAILSYGITVDKDELLRALKYDRNQYEKGYMDGKAEAMVELVRCKECKMEYGCRVAQWLGENGFCSYGERKDNERKAD